MKYFRSAMLIILCMASQFICMSAAAQATDIETVSLDTARMDAFLSREAEKLSREAWERIDSREKIEHERERLLEEFKYMIGLDIDRGKTDLKVDVVRTIDKGEYSIEVLSYQSMPGFYVTANLYLPKTGNAPYPAVVWGPGHSPHENGAKALRQLYAIPWVRSGYICLMIDPVQVAEMFGVHRGTHSWDSYDWFCRGYTPAGIEVWNAIRGLDYLHSRNDVDSDRITINGVSGGGHLSWMAGAADSRFTVVQPVAGTADIQAHVQLDLQRRHCDCAYFINIFRHDWPTLAAIIAPRPLLMHNSSDDAYYPPEGYQRVLEKAKDIYSVFGAEERTDIFEVPGNHGYYKEQREKAVEWSDRWLLDKKSTVIEREFVETDGKDLDAIKSATMPDAINSSIQELFIPKADPEVADTPANWSIISSSVRTNVDKYVLRNMPLSRQATIVETVENGVVLETEQGIFIGMSSYIPESDRKTQPAMLYVASPGETIDGIWNYLRSYPFIDDITARWIVFPRGTGNGIWNDLEYRRFERCAMLLGRSVDEMRLHDVLCAVEYISAHPSFDGLNLTICGKERQSVLAAYAALLDKRIIRVIVSKPPVSHGSGPIFLNILRYTDIPQIFAMLAPRELVFLSDNMQEFKYTRGVYALIGAENSFRRAYTVTQVLNGR